MARRFKRDDAEGKGARTRARLIEAAYALFLEKGIAGASLQDIASRAGVTTGAIYGRFKNKDELILAVGQAKSVRLEPQWAPGEPLAAQMHAFGTALAAQAQAMTALVPVALEQLLHAARDAKARDRAAAHMREGVARRARVWRDELGQTDLPLGPEDLVLVTDALVMGLIIHRAIAPELVSDRLLAEAFEVLGRAGGPQPPGQGRASAEQRQGPSRRRR